jgi:hypothetical protein|tara:strand:- start:110 stop:307 length:198 start_codon:yes stop_codon:yes gene_type:complete
VLPALKEIKDLKVVAEFKDLQVPQDQQAQQDPMVLVLFYTIQLLLKQYLTQDLLLVHGVVEGPMQ